MFELLSPLVGKTKSIIPVLEFLLLGDNAYLHIFGPQCLSLFQCVLDQGLSKALSPERGQDTQSFEIAEIGIRPFKGYAATRPFAAFQDKIQDPFFEGGSDPVSGAVGGVGGTIFRGQVEALGHIAESLSDQRSEEVHIIMCCHPNPTGHLEPHLTEGLIANRP